MDDYLGLAVDTYNVWWDPALERALTEATALVAPVHIADWLVPTTSLLAGRGLPGNGIIDLVGILRSLRRNGYTGPVEVEVLNPEVWRPPGGRGRPRGAGADGPVTGCGTEGGTMSQVTRVLVAPDSFKGTMSSIEVAEALAAGVRDGGGRPDLSVAMKKSPLVARSESPVWPGRSPHSSFVVSHVP